MGKFAPSPLDQRAQAVADRLTRASKRQQLPGALPMLGQAVRSKLRDGTWDPTMSEPGKRFLADKYVALDPEKAALCYLLCRSLDARRVVEVGTSYGVSTIYLASAIRDNLAAAPGESGTVIGTEHEPAKVAAAREHLVEAGVADYADILAGDLRETLPAVDGPIDFVLVDIWIPMAEPALRILEPKLRRGALVVCDNIVSGASSYRAYTDYVRDPDGPFQSVTVPGRGGIEVSMKR
ncbi:MAG: class I SAM-dependent methyltransferase [Gordonia sp. (in: high G+C Gram-positive bacteria)]|uniref:O-methyltransferase n=1 Tax=Gordonia sp. (in: high G+C Gram-positive bacteria) TaxID=84139 RepID=UPI0039E4B7DF